MRSKKILFPVLRETLLLFLKRFSFATNLNIKQRVRTGEIIPLSGMESFLNVANVILISKTDREIKVGLVKDSEYDAENHFAKRADWPKYERFLKNNKINYSYYDIHSTNWQNVAEKFDVIIWHPQSSPDLQAEAESKIYFLEKYMGKKCFPSFDEIWSYEDKVRSYYLYTHLGLPAVPTFLTNSRDEALEFINKTSYPVISKISTGSASRGVIRLNNKRSAFRYVNLCFSKVGRKSYWPFLRQTNYVYFQKYIESAKYDLRIIIVGNKIFGYYRFPEAGDFRASGAGNVEKKALPEDAMKIAVKVKELFRTTSLAVDMLFSEEEKKFYIIETSIFCGVDTAEQLVVDGKPGYYDYDGKIFTFREGRFWIQELMLQEFFNSLFK